MHIRCLSNIMNLKILSITKSVHEVGHMMMTALTIDSFHCPLSRRSSNLIRAQSTSYPLYLRKFQELENRKPKYKISSNCGHSSDSNLEEKQKGNGAGAAGSSSGATTPSGERRKPFAFSKQMHRCSLAKSISIDSVQTEVRILEPIFRCVHASL